MSSVMAYFLLWIMLVDKQECALIHMDHRNRNAYEYVVQKYVNPLRRLSADLPNHAIEMQIEFHGTVPRASPNPQRRVIHLINQYQPKPNLRSMQGADDVVTPEPGLPDQSTTATPAAVPDSTQPTPAPPPTPQEPEPSDSSKIPVFMEDLQKALDELEKKLATSTMSTMPLTVPSSSVRSIDEIVQMLKKGVHVEHRLPRAGDEKLEWVQIKIPKNMRF